MNINFRYQPTESLSIPAGYVDQTPTGNTTLAFRHWVTDQASQKRVLYKAQLYVELSDSATQDKQSTLCLKSRSQSNTHCINYILWAPHSMGLHSGEVGGIKHWTRLNI